MFKYTSKMVFNYFSFIQKVIYLKSFTYILMSAVPAVPPSIRKKYLGLHQQKTTNYSICEIHRTLHWLPMLHFTVLQFWKEIKALFLKQVFQAYFDIVNMYFKKDFQESVETIVGRHKTFIIFTTFGIYIWKQLKHFNKFIC